MNDRERNKRFRAELARRRQAEVKLKAETAAEVVRLLREAKGAIAATLANQPSDYQAWRLPRLQKEVRRAIEEIEWRFATALTQGLEKGWAAGIATVDAPLLAGGLDVTASLVQLDNRVLLAMQSFATDRVKDISTTLVNRVNGELANVVIGVQTPYEATRKVAAVLDGGAQRAGTIIRTELGRAYSAAAQGRMEQAATVVPGLQKQWRRSGKLKARISHDAIDGQIQPVDKPFILDRGVELMYPRDPAGPPAETINCGCTSLPYMASWDMLTPGRKPYSDDELARSPTARLLAPASNPGF